MLPQDGQYGPKDITDHEALTKQHIEKCSGSRFADIPKPEVDNNDKIYHPLDSEQREVRMCTVDIESQGVSCTLSTTNLDEAGDYVCLSYVWGDPNKLEEIQLNKYKHNATVNLDAALRSLRYDLRGRRIWIDALCINQKYNDEKDLQIPLMADLYRNATEVWIWLGDGVQYEPAHADNTSAGASRVDGVEAVEELLECLSRDMHFHEMPYFSKCASSHCPGQNKDPAKSWRTAFNSLAMMMDSPWFERTWTIQEVVLAKRAVAIFRGKHSPWELIEQAMIMWNRHLNRCCSECLFMLDMADFDAMHRYAGNILDLINAKQSWLRGDSILQPLLKFRSKEASDNRDKIYGLLGLQSGPKAIPIKPDSGQSCIDLYVRFAVQLIKSQGWIVPLHLDLAHNYSGLPSWVPDWTYYAVAPSGYAVN